MSGPRYLVTGGAGFIGSNLVAALVARGERVRVLDDVSTGSWAHLDGIEDRAVRHHVERIEGDIRDAEVTARAADGVEVVFHEAALGSVPRSIEEPALADAINTGGTVQVLEAARRGGARRVVFAASSAAYGQTPELPKREDMTPSPMSPYAVTKLAGELYMKVFSETYGLDTVSLRYFNIFGPNQKPDGAYAAAIPRFIGAAIEGRPITIYGDGEQTRDFCFVDNAVEANLLAASAPGKFGGRVINIGTGRRVSLNDVCAEIGKLVGRELAVERVAPRAGDIRHSVADVTLARDLLGFEPAISWEEGLAPTYRYLDTLRTHGPRAASHTLTTLPPSPGKLRS